MAYKTMTAAEIRQAVRDITDLDSTDVSDSLIDLYIRDGYYRILDTEKRWGFLEFSFTFQTSAGTRSYSLETIASEPMGQISSIVDNTGSGYRLGMIGYDEAEQTYIGAYDNTSNPLFYAVWADSIHLYPKPSDVRTLTCRGYREPYDWLTEGGDVDAHPSLHFPLVYYACSRVYQQLEDAAMADVYKRSFDEGVSLAIKNATIPTSHNPLRLTSGKTKSAMSFNRWLQANANNPDNWGV